MNWTGWPPAPADADHLPRMETTDGDLCFTFHHSMAKEHFLRFAALITFDRMVYVRLYPEQDALVRFPYARMGTLVYACSPHGLMNADLCKLQKI